MKNLYSFSIGFAALMFSLNALSAPPVTYQWDDNLTFHRDVKIIGYSLWKEDSPVFVRFDNESRCYIARNEKNIFSLLMTLYSSGKTTNVLCVKDQVVSYGGFSGERLSQLWQ